MNLNQLREKRAQLLREAEAFKGTDGTFKDDATRAAFDVKMTEIETIDGQIRTAAADEQRLTLAADPQAAATERARILGIQDACRVAKLDTTFAADLVGRNVTLDASRTAIFAELARRDAALPETRSHLAVGEDADDKFKRGVAAWLIARAGASMRDLFARAAKTVPGLAGVSTDAAEFTHFTLRDMARTFLTRHGVQAEGLSAFDVVAKAFQFRGNYQTTSDFAVLLESAMGKILLAAYAVTPDTWRLFCGTTTVPDFRDSPRYRSGSFGVLDDLTEDGEYKQKAIPDGQKTTVSTGTKGNIVGLNRAVIVNDDMGALTDMLTKLGRSAGLSIETDVYALILANAGLGPTQTDGQPFFHANRANVNAVGSALAVAAIDADAAIMAAQKDVSGNDYIDLAPDVLLVPRALKGTALTLNEAIYDPADNKFQKPNFVRGLFSNVVATARLTGTRRYLFASPSVAPAITVAFLEGQPQAPVLASQDGWRNDGVEWKVRIDYKAQMFDSKGAVTNAGA